MILERQGLALELDPMVSKNLWTHVCLGCSLNVRVSELEHDLWLARRKPIRIRNTSAQDEGIVVQPKISGIDEKDFTNFKGCVFELEKLHATLSGRRDEHVCEIEQALARREFIWSQHKLTSQIFDLVKGHTVGISAWLDLRTRPAHDVLISDVSDFRAGSAVDLPTAAVALTLRRQG